MQYYVQKILSHDKLNTKVSGIISDKGDFGGS